MRVWLFSILSLLPLSAAGQSCNDACMARKAEAQWLKAGLAERMDGRLVVTAGGRRLVFADNRKACDAGEARDCAIYALVANAPGSLAVQKFEFEGSDTYLIDLRSGRKTELDGVPVFSSDGRKFVIAAFSGDSENNLEVWRRTGDGAALEWAHPFRQSWTEDAALHGDTLENKWGLAPVFRVTGWQGDRVSLAISTDDQRHNWTGTLLHDAQGWHLSAKSPPGMFAKR